MSNALLSSGTMFVNGFLAPARGMKLILSNPRIRYWSIAPFLIAIIVFISVFSTGIPFLASSLSGYLVAGMTAIGLAGVAASGFTMFFVVGLAWIAALAGLVFVSIIITRLLAAPFAAMLAERVLIEQGVLKEQPFQLATWMKVNAGQLWIALVKAIAFGVIAVILIVLSFIPGLAVFTALGFLMIAAYDVFDPAFDALNLPFRERVSYFRSHLPCFAGFGLIFLIPGASFLLFPALIAGACDVVRCNPVTAVPKTVVKDASRNS